MAQSITETKHSSAPLVPYMTTPPHPSESTSEHSETLVTIVDTAIATTAVALELGLQQPTPPPSSSSFLPSAWLPQEASSIDINGAKTELDTAAPTPLSIPPLAPTLGSTLSTSDSLVSPRTPPPVSPSSTSDINGKDVGLGHGSNGALTHSEIVFRNRVEGQKNRFTFTDNHNAVLEKVFESNQYPTKSMKVQLSQQVGCTEVQVQNWFARRRTRAAQELLDKKEKQAILDKLDKRSTNKAKTRIGSEFKPESRVAPIDVKLEPQTLKAGEVSSWIARITRGNGLVNPEYVKFAVQLMEAAIDYDGRKYILNALLFTRSQPVLQEFAKSKGPSIFRTWMLEAKSSSDSSDNKDLLAKSIDFLARLPFDYKTLKECKLGKVVKKLATDDGIDQARTVSAQTK
ncbi:MAG: hypothetical protein J3Q66DRAFT_374239 [Benniella sp.]|nr:MAG: hypothetical protein J3Q66DRAFT_374239 [Benniella sp.]